MLIFRLFYGILKRTLIPEVFLYNTIGCSLVFPIDYFTFQPLFAETISVTSSVQLMRFICTIIIVLFARPVFCQLTYDNLEVNYDSAWTFKNLKVIPIRYKGPGNPASGRLTNMVAFNQALKQGLITVQERGTSAIENVHWLSLYNNSDKNVFISSGEILAGGRQDRMVSRDTIINAKSGRIDLPVMCVEEGRWSERDRKFVYQKMANMRLRKVLDQSKSQVQVWKEVINQLDREKINNKTLAYLSKQPDKNYTKKHNEYLDFFQSKFQHSDSTIVGMVCISGDNIIGSDIFAASNLFYGQLSPMLSGYTDEAAIFGAPPTLSNTAVKKYLDQFLMDEKTQEEFVKKNGKLFKAGGTVIHITTY